MQWILHNYTVNREYFDVKIFSDSMACAKIKRTKYMRDINDNAVQGRLSEKLIINAKNYRMKYFRHEIFAIYENYLVCTQLIHRFIPGLMDWHVD